MKKVKLILASFFLTLMQTVFACDCESQGEFLKVAPKTVFVALVKVTKYLTFKDIYEMKTPMSMEVEIVETYKGTETRKSITVWGDNGILCRPYLSLFDVEKYYVIAFFKGSDGSKGHVHANEATSDYSISVCGDYWLNVDFKNKIATGSVTDKQKQISLTDLKSRLTEK